MVGIEIDKEKVALLMSGKMPFDESGCQEILSQQIDSLNGRLFFTADYGFSSKSECLIVVPGTPLTDEGSPDVSQLRSVIESLKIHLRPGHTIILRSTVAPGTTEAVRQYFQRSIKPELFGDIDFAFAPERLVEGKAIAELHELPQIIGTYSKRAYERVSRIFSRLGIETLRAQPIEAELAKLFANNYRYTQFAIANEFFAICENLGVNFENVRRITNHNYARADIAKSGFARGPCLGKDSWLLMRAGNGHPLQSRLLMSAYLVNESLPEIAVGIAKRKLGGLSGKRVLVLGLAFKRDSDDTRNSMSPKLISLLESEFVSEIETHDPLVQPEDLQGKISRADIIFVATNHSAYDQIDISMSARPDCLIVDIWYQLNPQMGHGYFCRDIK